MKKIALALFGLMLIGAGTATAQEAKHCLQTKRHKDKWNLKTAAITG